MNVKPRRPAEALAASNLAYMRKRRDTKDASAPNGAARIARTDLGLHLMSILRHEGATFSRYDIALWCGCTDAGIYELEKRALKKLANKLQFGREQQFLKEMIAA